MPHSRAHALILGAKHYFTGKPCSQGHLVARHITGTCIGCQQIANRKWAAKYPDEASRRSAKWQKENPERARMRSLRYKRRVMGIPEAPYSCPTLCENCLKPPTKGGMHLDHDHITGKFRGWLCNKCNRGFGHFGDTLEGMQQGVRYLERAQEKNQ